MKIRTGTLLGLMLAASLCLSSCTKSTKRATISESEAESIGSEAYIYGYPLVTMEMTRRVMTNVASPEGLRAPMGQFINAREYPDTSFHDVTAPNADTLYSVAWLNLSQEPYILHLPDVNDRYYLMPMLSGWTNVFASPGTRTTGDKAGDYAITGPSWSSTLPSGIKEFKSPTNLVWLLGRTYSTGTAEDYDAVHKIQDEYSLTPLSRFGSPYTPPQGKVDPDIDMTTPVREQVNAMNAETFFTTLAQLMKENPPAKEDGPIVAKMARIGVIPGDEFDMSKLETNVAKGIKQAPKIGQEKMAAHLRSASRVNGWTFSLDTGRYGTDYLQRAAVAEVGLGANLPQDAIYPATSVDSSGKPLTGEGRYVIRFAKDQIPPVNGFWSLTMYNPEFFFVENPLNRYTLSPRNPLKYSVDGSLELYIQNKSPGKDKESNWLPAPEGNFILMLRLYWPKEALLDGSWTPPAVERID